MQHKIELFIFPRQLSSFISFKVMGNTKSAKKKQQETVAAEKGRNLQDEIISHVKDVLLLHNSNAAQSKVTRNFRNAFNTKAKQTVFVTDSINIADGNSIPHSRTWLEQINNVVLICLTYESIEQFQKLIYEQGFADQDGHLHDKVFTVTFGGSLTSVWPPKGLKKGSRDLKDFYFGFSDVENISPHDFERSLRMDSLIASIRLTD